MAKTINFSQTPSIEELCPKFETLDDARQRRVALVRQLLHGDHSAQQLAVKLDGCRGHRRYNSPICPMCVRALRRWFICETIACFNELYAANPSALRRKVVRFSGVPCEEEYPEGGLDAADLRRLNRRMQRRHERAGFPLVFAGVDVSLNVFDNAKSTRRWQIHFYGAVIGCTREHVLRVLSGLYPTGKNTWRPLDVERCNNLAAVVSYATKPYFYRRSGYFKPKTGRRDTWEEPLKGSEIPELAVWLDQYRLADRYLLGGCRKRGQHLVINPAANAELLGRKRGQN